MKTVKQVAEELGISRQAVYSKLTVEFKENFTSIKNVNGRETLVINSEGIEILKREIVKYGNQLDGKIDSELDNQLITLLQKNIEILQEQLKIKDTQIMELNERLKEAQELNKNNQVLLHRQQDYPNMIQSGSEKKEFWIKNLLKRGTYNKYDNFNVDKKIK